MREGFYTRGMEEMHPRAALGSGMLMNYMSMILRALLVEVVNFMALFIVNRSIMGGLPCQCVSVYECVCVLCVI